MTEQKSLFSPVHRSWQAYRYKHLVYFRHFKCASVFYLQLFEKMLRWEPICYTSIDWQKDHVFSYIRDPFEKRLAGLAEYVFRIFYEENANDFSYGTYLTLLEHPYFVRIIARTFILDDHTLPLYHILGTNAEKVDWIPIDCPTVDHVACTIKLLKTHGIDLNIESISSITEGNVSTGDKKRFITRLKQQPVPNLVISDLDYDNILYSHVVDFFDSTQESWEDVSWLKFHHVFGKNNEQRTE
jgi:hypothetical protein